MAALWTIADLEQRLKLSRSTILRLLARNELKAVRVGRSLRFSDREVERFIAAREAEATVR